MERRDAPNAQLYSRGTQSVALEASSIELSVVQNNRSVALRLVQLFWSRRIMAYKQLQYHFIVNRSYHIPAERQSSFGHGRTVRHFPPRPRSRSAGPAGYSASPGQP